MEEQEVLLEQRLRDAEAVEVFKVIEGGQASWSNNPQSNVKEIVINDNKFCSPDNEPITNPVVLPDELVVYEEF